MRRAMGFLQGSGCNRPFRLEAGRFRVQRSGWLTRWVLGMVCLGAILLVAGQWSSVSAQQVAPTLPPRPTLQPTLPPRPTIEPTLPPRPTMAATLPSRPTIAPTLPARPTLSPAEPPGKSPSEKATPSAVPTPQILPVGGGSRSLNIIPIGTIILLVVTVSLAFLFRKAKAAE